MRRYRLCTGIRSRCAYDGVPCSSQFLSNSFTNTACSTGNQRYTTFCGSTHISALQIGYASFNRCDRLY